MLSVPSVAETWLAFFSTIGAVRLSLFKRMARDRASSLLKIPVIVAFPSGMRSWITGAE